MKKKKWMELLYPPRCVLCDRVLPFGQYGCCSDCRGRLPIVRGPRCFRCGGPVGDGRTEYCPDCMKYRHSFDQGTAAFLYTGSMRHAVARLKFDNRRDYLAFFGSAMTCALMQYLPRWQPSVIVPVPMHPHKKRIRGYNQAELLACEVSRRTGIPVRTDLVRCVHLTRDQKQLDRKGRMQNLKGSFRMDGTLPAGTAVLLLDDVYTTGSTLDELSSVLRAHGAANIYFVVLCTGKGKNTVCTGEKL